MGGCSSKQKVAEYPALCGGVGVSSSVPPSSWAGTAPTRVAKKRKGPPAAVERQLINCRVCNFTMQTTAEWDMHNASPDHIKRASRCNPMYTCDLCHTYLHSEKEWAVHFQSRKHNHNEKMRKAALAVECALCGGCKFESVNSLEWEEHLNSPYHLHLVGHYSDKEWCEVCSCKVSGLTSWEAHLKGRGHKGKIRDIESKHNQVAEDSKKRGRKQRNEAMGPPVECGLCGGFTFASVNSPEWKAHLGSLHHTERVMLYSDKEWCEVCSRKITGYKTWESHLKGRGHKEKVQELESKRNKQHKQNTGHVHNATPCATGLPVECTPSGVNAHELFGAARSTATATDDWEAHVDSPQHKELLLLYSDKEWCEICSCKVSGQTNWEAHLKGGDHRGRVYLKQQQAPSLNLHN